MMGLNLHSLVSPLVAVVHPEEEVTLYQSTGQENVHGTIKPKYAAPQQVRAQVQSVGDAALSHADKVGQNDVTRHFYLFASPRNAPAGVVRPLARGGDMIQRKNTTWWLITATPEEFSRAGWVCVRGTLQVKAPDFSASDWWEEAHI